MERYLQKLHVYKSTANLEEGKKLYEHMTNVDDFWGMKVRDAVMKQKTPRKVFVQANTFEEGGQVTLKEYEPTPEAMIQSFADRGI